MKKTQITNSSSVLAIGYHPEKNQMEVSFHKTGDYLYSEVSEEEYVTIMSAHQNGGSIGSVLHRIVKGKPYINLGKEMRK